MDLIIPTISQGLLWALLAIGVYLTFRVLDIADLTVEGSFPLGAATAASLLAAGVTPLLAIFAAFVAGMISGVVTGLLTTKLKIPALLAGILTMIALYSVNLRIMGKANLPLLQQDTIFTIWHFGMDKMTATLIIGAVIVLLGLCAVPASGLRLALTDNGFAEKGSQQRETYDAVAAAYGEGYNSPIVVIADVSQRSDSVAAVQGLAQELSQLDGVEGISLATPNQDGTLALVQIRPEKSQADPATMELVHDIRSHAGDYESRYGLTDVMVTGQTAVAIDVAEELNAALIPFGVVVVGLSLILLMVVFRSIAVPLTATLGYLLSLGAGMGAVGAVFGWGWAADLLAVSKVGAVISFLPVIVMGVLFGLAMDYQVFLVSRMREEWNRRRGGATPAARHEAAAVAVKAGFLGSAKVVAAAAVIMTGVFVAFVHTDNVYVKPIALGLTVGIAADAFLVRMTLIPAIIVALGERAWWLPAWLDQLLPVVDVEGESLEQALEQEEADAG